MTSALIKFPYLWAWKESVNMVRYRFHDYVISVAKGVCPSEDSFSMIYSNHMGFISRGYSLAGSTKGNQRNLKCKNDFFSVAIWRWRTRNVMASRILGTRLTARKSCLTPQTTGNRILPIIWQCLEPDSYPDTPEKSPAWLTLWFWPCGTLSIKSS